MRKLISAEQLPALREREKSSVVVFTNGVFDIIHAGHVALLRYCKQKGDVVVVGVNTDSSVRRLKGRGRPINPLAHRLEVLSAVKYVDWVVPFEEDTPLRIIKLLKPDVLVKGGDYTLSSIVGAAEVMGWGGKVCIFPYRKGCSTTEIIKRILENAG